MKKQKISQSSLKLLGNKSVAILGYGSQGAAQALNLRDSGIVPAIGLPLKSRSRKAAKKDGFSITTSEEAIEQSDLIAVLVPDHNQGELLAPLSTSGALSEKALVFAHGMSIAFGLVKPPPDCDTILVAPHGPGLRLREKYLSGEPFTSFVGVDNDSSGKAGAIARAYAEAIGCPPEYQFDSTFRDEAIGDIFGEQAVLCGGLVGLMESGFELLVKKGLSEEAAYLECVYQLDLIVDMIKKYGPAGMFDRISITAAFGSLRKKDKLFGAEYKKSLLETYNEIESGKFVNELHKDYKNGMKKLKRFLEDSRKSKLQIAHDTISKKFKRLFRYSDRH